MRLGIVVTEFPKTTETFILRDLVEFRRRGHEVRVYHLSAFRKHEVVHGFARATLEWTRPKPFLLGASVLGALLRAVSRRPLVLARIVADIARGYRRNPIWLLKSIALLPKCLAIAEDLSEWDADHVHAEFAGHPATCAWIVGRMTSLPYSVSCHAHDIFRTRGLLDRKLGEASFVRPISEFNRQFLLREIPQLAATPLHVIHVSVDTGEIPALGPPSTDSFRVLYVGSLQTRKGVDVLLRALARAAPALGEWFCDVLGDGPERDALEALAGQLELGGRVRFHGAQPFEEVSKAQAAANVLAVPSIVGPGGRTEGIPTVIIETLAHQRPVIASRVSGIPELVVDRETGFLVEPGDVEELAEALCAVRDDPGAAFELARAGRRRIEAEFSVDVCVEAQLARFAESCADERRS